VRMDEGEGVFTKDKAPETLRTTALRAIEDTAFFPASGKSRLRDMIAGRPAPARLGRAHRRFREQGDRENPQ